MEITCQMIGSDTRISLRLGAECTIDELRAIIQQPGPAAGTNADSQLQRFAQQLGSKFRLKVQRAGCVLPGALPAQATLCELGLQPADTIYAIPERVYDSRTNAANDQPPALSPAWVPAPSLRRDSPAILPVVAFYCPGAGPTEWDLRTGGLAFGNFFELTTPLHIAHEGVKASFTNSEAAYQCLKWWHNAEARALFENCKSSPDDQNRMGGGEQAYRIKSDLEKQPSMNQWKKADFAGLGKIDAMLLVLRAKYAVAEMGRYLTSTSGMFLVEHCEVAARDLYWTDDYDGGGENRLVRALHVLVELIQSWSQGAALMIVRDELLAQTGGGSGWPVGLDRPVWSAGGEGSNWQACVDDVAKHLAAHTQRPPLTAY